MVEYAIMLALISTVAMGSVGFTGARVGGLFANAAAEMSEAFGQYDDKHDGKHDPGHHDGDD